MPSPTTPLPPPPRPRHRVTPRAAPPSASPRTPARLANKRHQALSQEWRAPTPGNTQPTTPKPSTSNCDTHTCTATNTQTERHNTLTSGNTRNQQRCRRQHQQPQHPAGHLRHPRQHRTNTRNHPTTMLHPRRYNRATHRRAPGTTTNSIQTIRNTNTRTNKPTQHPHHHHHRQHRRPHHRLRYLRTPTPVTTPTSPKATASNTPSPASPHHQRRHRRPLPPQETKGGTTGEPANHQPPAEVGEDKRPEPSTTTPSPPNQPQGAIHHAVISGTHTTGGTTLTNSITSSPRHLLCTPSQTEPQEPANAHPRTQATDNPYTHPHQPTAASTTSETP